MPRRVSIPWRTPLAASLSAFVLSACSASPARTLPGVDCNAGSGYELSPPERTFEEGGDQLWYSGADGTGTTAPAVATVDPACGGGAGSPATPAAGTGGVGGSGPASISVALEPIEGERCGSRHAMVLRSAGHTDWGSVFGDWVLASAGADWDASGFEGIAIWARAGAGDRAVTLLLDTWQTSASGTSAADVDAGLVCRVDCNGGSGTQTIDEAGNVTSQTYVSPPGTCGNSFARVIELTTDWQLHLLPFSSFHQELKPNMVAGGLDPSHINGITIRVAKEASVELWIDDIAFYRPGAP